MTTPLPKYHFPLRLAAAQLPSVYPSLEEAFAAHDPLYVARYAHHHPELRGCALLLLGNRVGGERILDAHNIQTGRAFYYRAYAAWQDDDLPNARRWLAESTTQRFDPDKRERLARLMERKNFRVLCHWDFHNDRCLEPFRHMPGIELVATRLLPQDGAITLPTAQPLASVVPEGAPLDLILLDDVKMIPIGIRDLGAPVVAAGHDIEWNYDFLPHVLPDIDVLSFGSSSEAIEVGRAFNTPCTVHFFPLHMDLPKTGSIAETLTNGTERTTDIFYSGSLGHDFYRYKKQAVLPLSGLDRRFSVKINETFYPIDDLWKEMRNARFSIMSSRCCNYVATRAMESIACGAFHLIEEEDGVPFFFSEHYACFPVYRREHILEDVEKHLNNYADLRARFQEELPRFEAEFQSVLPADPVKRALRYVRHLLFITHVEKERRPTQTPSPRRMIYLNEHYRFLERPPALATQFLEQTQPPHWLRRAFGLRVLRSTEGQSEGASLTAMKAALIESLTALPDSLALHHMLGVCQKLLGEHDAADATLANVVEGSLTLYADDPPPVYYGRISSAFWMNDARVRQQNPADIAPLVPPEDVWKSAATASRAEIALSRDDFQKAAHHAGLALNLFPYNEDIQHLYLRAAYRLAEHETLWAARFLEAFEAGCHNDTLTLHDFAAPAFHLLMKSGCMDEAFALLDKVKLYLTRVELINVHYNLYPEYIPLLRRYGIPHARLPNEVS